MAESHASGLGFPGALTLLFIAFKLSHVIDWPWVWVLSPLWVSISLLVALVLVLFLAKLADKW